MSNEKVSNKKTYPRIDTANDAEMVREGLRVPAVFIDRRVFINSKQEKEQLKLLKTKSSPKGVITRGSYTSNIPLKCVVYMQRSPKVKNFKSTHTFTCLKEEVSSRVRNLTDEGYVVKKVYFNNHVY